MRQYLELLDDVLSNGIRKADRTGTGTVSVFGRQTRFDLSDGFPLLTTKKLHWKSIVHELLWFLRGDTNIKYLNDHGVRIWDEWADENGDLGPIYGKQWRGKKSYRAPFHHQLPDQISDAVQTLLKDPDSRRIIVSSWNVELVDSMKIPPCHVLFQFYAAEGKLSCQLYQRSADLFLGVPFNIASYSLLTLIIAEMCGLQPGEFVHTFGDLHLYRNHEEQAREQLKREPRKAPHVEIVKNIRLSGPEDLEQFKYEDLQYEDFKLMEYNPHPHIAAEISV